MSHSSVIDLKAKAHPVIYQIPLRVLELLPLALIALYVPRYFTKNSIEMERRMTFEESAPRTVEGLRLSE
jgi:hypothetical protein